MQRSARVRLIVIAAIALVIGIIWALIVYDMHVIDTIDERCLEYYGYNDAKSQADRDAARQAAHDACGTAL
jgi:hypothetical protein